MRSIISELEETRDKINAELFFRRSQSQPDIKTTNCNEAMTGREKTAEEIIADLFTYHSPDEKQAVQYETIRDAAKHFALVIWKNCPYGADRTAAIRKLREAVMTANAAISLHGVSLPQ